jgi:hypothetical protein
MTTRQPNLIDKLAGFIPGYRGYAERETRRAQDKRLREHLADQLDRSKRHLDRVSRELTDAGELEPLDGLDGLKRVIGTSADSIRHAQAGGSGLMDDVVVKAEDLDRVHAHDLELHGQVHALIAAVESLSAENAETEAPAVRELASGLLLAVERRDAILREVFE